MIFENRYKQCEICSMSNLCKYKEDYYKNKGGDWRDEILDDDRQNCKYAPFK